MKRGIRPELVWGVGLSDSMAEDISAAMGSGLHLRNFPTTTPPRKRDMEKENPLVVFILSSVWGSLPPSLQRALRDWDAAQRVMLLDAPLSAGYEDLTEQGFLTAVSLPLTDKKVRDVIFRAKEVRSLYDDIFRMTREIMLERELLSRKTDLLLFLNRMLTRASESLDPATILVGARQDLNILFPIRALHAAIWNKPEGEPLEAEFFLEADLDQAAEEGWIEYLLERAGAVAGEAVSGYQVRYLTVGEEHARAAAFDPSRLILLPLRAAGKTFGALAIDGAKDRPLGKDQVDVLHASVSHLSLALHNAALFAEVKTRADHDGLTRIHNRQSFDERLVDELRRHQRYKHHLSLLMIDLDFFKQVNDSYGHLAGDMVLREMGKILNESLRSTDFAARYGGEEFAVILPQTVEEQAWMLAERLRRKVEARKFEYEGQAFQVTASIGAATLRPGALLKRKDLLRQADDSLYRAKQAGRNIVVMSRIDDEAGDQAHREAI